MTTTIAGPLTKDDAERAERWITDARWDGYTYLATYGEILAEDVLAPHLHSSAIARAWLVVALSRRAAELRLWEDVTA